MRKIVSVAGSGVAGSDGDGGNAVDAELATPSGLAVSPEGELFVADRSSHRVRRIDPAGRITTVAGDGQARFGGDGGPAGKASLSQPGGLALDGDGNLLIADTGNNRVRRIDTSGAITTIAGTGSLGAAADGIATKAVLNQPSAVSVSPSGMIYVAEGGRVRRIGRDGRISTLAGGGTEVPTAKPQPGTSIALGPAVALAPSGDERVVVALSSGHLVRVDRAGMASLIAGGGTAEGDVGGQPATSIGLPGLSGLAADSKGNLFVAQATPDRVLRIDTKGTVHALASLAPVPPPTGVGPPRHPLRRPGALAAGRGDDLFVVDVEDHQVDRVSDASKALPPVTTTTSTTASPKPVVPVLKRMSPATGGAPGDTTVTLEGEHLPAESLVLFGDRRATVLAAFRRPADTTITGSEPADVLYVLSPPSRAGKTVDVVVANGTNGPRSAPMTFAYTEGWERAAPLVFSRLHHTATLIDAPGCRSSVQAPAGGACGKVLVAGGNQAFCVGCAPMNSAELYDPAADLWQLTGLMHRGRMEHTATPLEDGRILAVGGKGWLKREGDDYQEHDSALASAETYDPGTGTWTRVANMAEARFGHTATLLTGTPCEEAARPTWCGKVLVVGGATKEVYRPPLASAELFDPATGTWSPAGSLAERRADHSASSLPDGRVLVAGGLAGAVPDSNYASSTLASVEIYDPATNAWSAGRPMGVARTLHTSTTLGTGQVLVVGGSGVANGRFLRSAELFDPTTGAWQVAGLANDARSGHTATLLPSGSVLVAGGGPAYIDAAQRPDSVRASEVYDPATKRWSRVRALSTARGVHSAVALDGPACRTEPQPPYCGAVLVAGGGGTSPTPEPNTSPIPLFTTELFRG